MKKINVKVTFENKDCIYSSINTDLEGAKKYYLGKSFNLGGADDNISKVVLVEQII